jgi:hypothetical protein
MGDFRIGVQTPGLEEAVANFDKLDASQKKAFQAAVGLDRAQRNVGKAARSASDEVGSACRTMVGQLAGVASGTEIVLKLFAAVKADMERIQHLDAGAAAKQREFAAASGALLARGLKPAEVGRYEQFAKQQSAASGVSTTDILGAAAALEQTGADGNDIRNALARGVQAKRLAPGLDLAGFAGGTLRVQQALGVGAGPASNLSLLLDEGARKDLAGAKAFAAGSGMSLPQVLALQELMEQRAGIEPAAARGGLEKALKLGVPAQRLAAGNLTAFDIQRIRRAKGGATLAAALEGSAGTLAELQGSFAGALGGGDLIAERLAARGEAAMNAEAGAQTAAKLTVSQINDIPGGRRDVALANLRAERDRRRLGFFQDPSYKIREYLVSTGALSGEEAQTNLAAADDLSGTVGAAVRGDRAAQSQVAFGMLAPLMKDLSAAVSSAVTHGTIEGWQRLDRLFQNSAAHPVNNDPN